VIKVTATIQGSPWPTCPECVVNEFNEEDPDGLPAPLGLVVDKAHGRDFDPIAVWVCELCEYERTASVEWVR